MARVAAVGQVPIGDVGAGPYLAPTPYGLIINTSINPIELRAASARAGKKYDIKITDNTGLEKTYVVTRVDSSAGWYTTITIGQDLTKVFTTSRSLAFVMTEQTTAPPPPPPSINRVTGQRWDDLGCWGDTPDRAISGGYVGTPGAGAYTVQKCYDHAVSKGDDIFALQAGFACFTGKESTSNYKKYGAYTGPCSDLGDAWVNHVYKVKSTPLASPPPPPAPVTPPTIANYSSWTPLADMLTDFTTQTRNIITSLGDTTNRPNPAPYMTALDTDVNAIRDQVKIRQLQSLNAQNIEDARDALAEATNMSEDLKKSQNEADVIRRQIALSSSQSMSYQNRFLPLQILAGTLAIVLFVYFLAGFILPMAVASTLAMVMLAGGLGAAVYFAFKQT